MHVWRGGTHLGYIVKVDDQLYLLSVSDVSQLLGISEHLTPFTTRVSVELGEESLYLLCSEETYRATLSENYSAYYK